MAPYKVDKSKLLKVGFEGFEMLEQVYPRQQKGKNKAVTSSSATAKSCIYQYQPPQTLVYQVSSPVSATEEMISSYGATKLDYNGRKSAAVAY